MCFFILFSGDMLEVYLTQRFQHDGLNSQHLSYYQLLTPQDGTPFGSTSAVGKMTIPSGDGFFRNAKMPRKISYPELPYGEITYPTCNGRG